MTDAATHAFTPAMEAIEKGLIPGAVLGVLAPDGSRSVAVAGRAQVEPAPVPMTRQTWFDLASLTKVVFTTTAVMRQVEAGRIRLDDTLASAIPDLRQYDVANAAERRLTFRQCLSHQTHLPAVEPLYTYGQDGRTLEAFILQREWRAGPPVYSDINFILLGIALQRITGRMLRQLATGGFTFGADPALCAATERCAWRGRVMRGEVHDENAFALGGASGHAGLFGTVDLLLDFAHGLLRGTALHPDSIRELRKLHSPTRGLGWEVAHPGWPGGDACSPETIGHTGFTGTGLWIDFATGKAWALLTNRVHPSRHTASGIAALRRAVGGLV